MNKNEAKEVVEILKEALPYIQKFASKICVVKFGGAAMTINKVKEEFAKDIALMRQVGIHVIVVHGGGPQIDRALKEVNIEKKFINGLRVTDKDSMNIVAKVLSDEINQELSEMINSFGGITININKDSEKILLTEKISSQIDLGYVGQIKNVDTNFLINALQSNYIPVIAPLGFNENNEIFNINADDVACSIAASISAEKLILMTDQEGVLNDNGELLTNLDVAEVKKLIKKGIISGGMLPKVNACITALGGGVKKTHIIDGRVEHAVLLELFTNTGIGTLVNK